ncbi:hypothetical protein LSH36_456g03018 [Paralvinella palmiformis]|uniref:Uncharacterized protein n=1 Tax=Paralvinella palmiformis TaxID=53620 RepID=A0AAD9MYY9_9ANNE|nr:hypothetical protein LSH36_456g03018 [Paralvinella palmiformis]
MSFESPDMAKDFPGLYRVPEVDSENHFEDEDKPSRRKDVLVRRRDSRPERRGKGYRMFEEEDSEEELVAEDTTKYPLH